MIAKYFATVMRDRQVIGTKNKSENLLHLVSDSEEALALAELINSRDYRDAARKLGILRYS